MKLREQISSTPVLPAELESREKQKRVIKMSKQITLSFTKTYDFSDLEKNGNVADGMTEYELNLDTFVDLASSAFVEDAELYVTQGIFDAASSISVTETFEDGKSFTCNFRHDAAKVYNDEVWCLSCGNELDGMIINLGERCPIENPEASVEDFPTNCSLCGKRFS